MIGYLLDTSEYVLTGFITCILFIVCYSAVLKILKNEISFYCKIIMLLLGVYLSVLFSVTVSPMYGYTGSIHLENVNLIPGQVLKDAGSNPLNFIGNIFLFIPLGILVPMVSKNYQKFISIVRLGFCISLVIELMQLFLGRGTDIDDLILNTIGTVVGYTIYIILYNLLPQLNEKKLKINKYRTSVILLVILMLCTVMVTGFNKRMDLFNPLTNEKAVLETHIKKQSFKPVAEEKQFQNLSLEANNVCFVNATKNKILFSIKDNEKIAPASTTKMLTALTTLEFCNTEEQVKVGDEVNLIASDASRAGLRVGNLLTVKQLLEGLLLPSGNDAAYVLAVYAGRKIAGEESLSASDAIGLFVKKMNEKALELGAKHSNFVKPDGYDCNEQYTTAYDLACIAAAFMKSDYDNHVLKNTVKEASIRECFADNTDITWRNTNELINPDSKFYYQDAVGLKTGSSEHAGKCLISAVNKNDSLYIAVVMGDSENGRYKDSIALYEALDN